jgi:hypothetical protein
VIARGRLLPQARGIGWHAVKGAVKDAKHALKEVTE